MHAFSQCITRSLHPLVATLFVASCFLAPSLVVAKADAKASAATATKITKTTKATKTKGKISPNVLKRARSLFRQLQRKVKRLKRLTQRAKASRAKLRKIKFEWTHVLVAHTKSRMKVTPKEAKRRNKLKLKIKRKWKAQVKRHNKIRRRGKAVIKGIKGNQRKLSRLFKKAPGLKKKVPKAIQGRGKLRKLTKTFGSMSVSMQNPTFHGIDVGGTNAGSL